MIVSAVSERLAHGARWQGDDLVLSVRVIPRAASDAVTAETDCLKVRLRAPPVEGKANRALCKVLGALCGVPSSRVRVEAGGTARRKRVRVIDPGEAPALLRP